MKEKTSFELDRFKTSDGFSTCYDEETKEFCRFYRIQCMGMSRTCIFAPAGRRGMLEELEHEENRVIPGNWCPIWPKEER